ncbi:kinesin-like protein KIN-7F [Gastrolobium bilobum]|uniref:kinesin-like protein KIN-7F n=1 Tax=Gastrolobium bilobum TaxID=150636 RepID=UPI002AAFC4A6|nr:kinesin-like protein KIN-7F [Gastrolobium bilobum]
METYTFDRVFEERSSTEQVYEQGIKEVALSVVRGINSSIFAYGQTSSGKTYTMTGITEYAIRDIYDYIQKHKEREFVVKFSAMEIYNEVVRDLLNANATSLRLLDDPEKGTVVEKLTEETLTERRQLQQLLLTCAAERTTEETAMNEYSSRSHQILRLTVESNPSDYVGTARSGTLVASVNFVDLAGSERASQALSAGARLREGSHINRSLLTLGSVIRKLSKERNGHIPYRDSKLTRILHNSLGGNARTAIICTISPARSQVEQSKNTLFFAGCAKQVTTNAQVNLVMSDKVLVKKLQNELARMENELRSFGPNTTLLKERELRIEQMDKEIKELTRQRDLFQSHVENLLQSVGKDRLLRVDKDVASESSGVANNPRPGTDKRSENLNGTTSSVSISNEHFLQQPENSEDSFLLDGSPPMFVGPDPCEGWEEIASRAESEDNCMELPCIEIKEVETDHKADVNTSIPVFEESGGNTPMIQVVNEDAKSSSGNGHSELSHVTLDNSQDAVQQKTRDLQRTNDLFVDHSKESSGQELKTTLPPQLDELEQVSSTLPAGVEKEYRSGLSCFLDKLSESKLNAKKRRSSRKYSVIHEMDAPVEDVESVMDSDTEDTASVLNFVVRMNERAKSKPLNKDFDDHMVCARTPGINKRMNRVKGVSFHGVPGAMMPSKFEMQQRDIIELWDACNVPLVHRSYFFLLIKGELSDSVFLDVELRRLSFLKDTFSRGTYITGEDGLDVTPNSSLLSLDRERKMLSKQVHKKFWRKEREELYLKWRIDLKSKHRSIQLAWLLWSNTRDLNHVRESAALVAKLVGLINSGEAPKKIFGLGFLAGRKSRKSHNWNDTVSTL